jgi:hypothetical protein
MDRAILILRDPFDKTMERILQSRFSHAPVKAGQRETLCEKVQLVAGLIFYLAITPISLALYAVAAILDGLRQKCNPKRFTYLEGSALEKKGPVKRIATWNVCALFGGLCIPFGGMAPVGKRVSLIAKKIIDTGADVVSLQEVSPPAADLLYRILKKKIISIFM